MGNGNWANGTPEREEMLKKNKRNIVLSVCVALVVCLLLGLLVGIVDHAKKGDVPSDAIVATGSAPGIHGEDVTVKVTATPDTILAVEVVSHNETEGIGDKAVADVPGKIVEGNSLLVDGVSGATVTSDAIKDAIRNALTSAGLDAAAFDREPNAVVVEQAEDATYDADVVVVGAGGAGMTAAINANDAGAKVIIVESQSKTGGNSVRAEGSKNAADTKLQNQNEFAEAAGIEKKIKTAREDWADNETIQELADTVEQQFADYQANPEGYFDSVELMELDTLIGGKGMNDPALLKTLAENSAGGVEWLDSIGAHLTNVGFAGGASVKRIHRPLNENGEAISVGSYIVPILTKNTEDRNIEILYNTTATHILTDDNGAAVGVEAVGSTGEKVTVNAKAVVLATGGFGANFDLIEQYHPEYKGFMTTNAPGSQGTGIVMAQEIGAAVVDMDQIQIHPTVLYGSGGTLVTEGVRGDGAILVNQEGKRFFDECSTRDKVSAAEIEQTGGYAYLIVDQKMMDASKILQEFDAAGSTKKGETIEDLAAALEIDGATLAETLETWNGYVAEGKDADFDRTSFTEALDTAPYYALQVTPGVHHTMGGIKINPSAEVMKEDGSVIPGLFAAGETTGGVHGGNRLGGTAVTDIIVYGRIAGNNAAEYVK